MKSKNSGNVSLKIKNEVAVVTFNDQVEKVNTLSSKLFDEVSDIFTQIEANNSLRGVVLISGKPDCFIAGADIHEVKSKTSAAQIEALSLMGQEFLNRIAHSKKSLSGAEI